MTVSAVLEPLAEETKIPTVLNAFATVPVSVNRVVLTGFMGAGKTTVGRMLAARLGWTFHDLDDEIEGRRGKTVPEIFSESGEAVFRRQESAALASVLGKRHMVLALGGGAPEVFTNRLMLEQTPHTTVVYLKAPLATLVARCRQQAEESGAEARPLLGEAEERFERRHRLYERMARHHVTTTELEQAEVVSAILESLQERL
jgi:shikimate kinase